MNAETFLCNHNETGYAQREIGENNHHLFACEALVDPKKLSELGTPILLPANLLFLSPQGFGLGVVASNRMITMERDTALIGHIGVRGDANHIVEEYARFQEDMCKRLGGELVLNTTLVQRTSIAGSLADIAEMVHSMRVNAERHNFGGV
jgi:hypothetical protein